MKHALVTGSCGLVGSAVTWKLLEEGWEVTGVDSGARATYFEESGNTLEMLPILSAMGAYRHWPVDLCMLPDYWGHNRFDLVVHAAAQPSHDYSGAYPLRDFRTNVHGTIILLETHRHKNPEAPFVFLSSNKVYGDRPNSEPLIYKEDRVDFAEKPSGIPESYSVDRSTHSPFGAGKLAADVYVQEYGRYYLIPTACLRCGCLTGEEHRGVELHGFLSYLIRCARENKPYTIFGYGGRQVRDNLHADDVAGFIWEFVQNPRIGQVYNLGGGRENSCSILEAVRAVKQHTGCEMKLVLSDHVRKGDHHCYYSDLGKCRLDYPRWKIKYPLQRIFERMLWQKS